MSGILVQKIYWDAPVLMSVCPMLCPMLPSKKFHQLKLTDNLVQNETNYVFEKLL